MRYVFMGEEEDNNLSQQQIAMANRSEEVKVADRSNGRIIAARNQSQPIANQGGSGESGVTIEDSNSAKSKRYFLTFRRISYPSCCN